MQQAINQTITIDAPLATVWALLTTPALMTQWMAEPEMALEIITDWTLGSPIVMQGFHHIHFENKGTILHCEPLTALQYNYLSSISRLPDTPENYTIVSFQLTPAGAQTVLSVLLENFPTEAILKHVDFYWRTAVVLLKSIYSFTHRCLRPPIWRHNSQWRSKSMGEPRMSMGCRLDHHRGAPGYANGSSTIDKRPILNGRRSP
jgi:uncharacterized protein YndB with AHSA1/START domain